MERLDFFNRMLPVMQDFLTSEDSAWHATSSRWLDRASWGIVRRNSFMTPLVIPVSPTADVPNNAWDVGEFTVVLDTETGIFSVGAGSSNSVNPAKTGGVAYDVNGERIAIENDAVFDFSNDIPQGKKSSGNIDIPLTLTGTVGGCNVNLAQFGTYYVWMEYLETNDPAYQSVGKDGVIHYPVIQDGYRIRMTGTPVAPSGDGVSIFLAKIVWLVSFPGTLTVTDGSADQDGNGNLVNTLVSPPVTGGDPSRVYSLIRDRQVEIQVDTDNDRTQSYAKGMRMSVHEHVNAVGSADPSPSNPHGLTLADIPGGTSEPKSTQAFQEGLAHGLVDRNLTNNSPVFQTSAGLATIVNGALQPSGLDVTAIAGTGVNSALQRSWVRVSDLVAEQSAFVSGMRLKRLYPTVRQTSDHTSDASIDPTDPDTGDGFIGFSDQVGFADPAGTYRLRGTYISVAGTDTLFLSKVLVDSATFSVPAPDLDEIDFGLVYWDGSNLFHDYLQNEQTTVVEGRSAGLVGPGQISTEAKMDANTGALSRVVLENRIGNSQFQFDKPVPGGEFPSWTIYDASGLVYLPNANILQRDYTYDSTLITGGPAALTGVQLTPIAGNTAGITKLYGLIDRKLKPNTFYSISFSYKAGTGWNSRLRVGINSNNSGGIASVLTTGSPATQPLDVLVAPDDAWHRTSMVVQTNGFVSPVNPYYLELRLDAPDASYFPTGSTADPIIITNIQVQEGEWVTGYMGSQYVPSGAILLWDQTDTCPPGFVEVTDLRGRYPVGMGTGLTLQQKSAAALNPSSPAIATSAVPDHNHSSFDQDKGDVPPTATYGGNTPAGGHSHTLDAGLPYYSLLFCRAI